MKKILFLMALSVSFLFSAINLQTSSKDELMCIKGIGAKKADDIIKYRKSNKLKTADDLLGIKGFGKVVVAAVKKGEKNVKCGGKKSTKTTKPSTKKESNNKDTSKKSTESNKKKDNSKKTSEKKEEK